MNHLLTCTAALMLTASLSACGGGSDDAAKNSASSAPAAPTSNASASPNASTSPSAGASSTGGSSSPATYTMADVQKHNNEQSCWTAIDGKVYDVTPWISQHPGGPGRIKGLCGTDGSGAFNGQHSSDTEPHERLASFQIGTLAG